MEQIGDTIERVLQDVEDKKIRKSRSFSDAGMAEICHLHERLLANLRLGMSVFLDGHVRDAKKLLEEKARFRDLEHEYAGSHIGGCRTTPLQSIETSSLHLDLISDLKRINSHICSIAYPILDSAGVLARRRASATPAWRRSPQTTPTPEAALDMLSAGRHCPASSPAAAPSSTAGEPVTQLEHALQTAYAGREQIRRRRPSSSRPACCTNLGHLLQRSGRHAHPARPG